MGMSQAEDWVLLAYRLPRLPSTPRSAVWRKLKRLGVAQLGDGLVALPADPRTREQLEWVAEEVTDHGGEATLWLGRPLDTNAASVVVSRMTAAVAAEYQAVAAEAAAMRTADAVAQRRAVLKTHTALADAIEPARLKTLILLAAWCGVRWGEVSELRRKDIGPGCETLTVARGVTHRDGECIIATPKSGKGRVVVVPPHIREDIKHHLDTAVPEDQETLLFWPAQRGCHIHHGVFHGHFQAALRKIGRSGVRVHDLRHFSGTQTARVGNLVETMDRLGHSTVRASLLYQQAVSGRDAQIAEALSELAANGGKPAPSV